MNVAHVRTSTAFFASVVVSWLVAQTTLAQDAPARLFGWNNDANSWQCNLAIACDEEECGDLVCIQTEDFGGYCSATRLGVMDAQCCGPDMNDQCKHVGPDDSLDGVCAEIDDASDPKNPRKYHVCTYPGVFDFCASTPGAPTFDNLHDCFTTPAAGKGPEMPTDDWFLGDCDKDGIENKRDCCPCSNDCDLVPPDCEQVVDDGGVPDSGMDAGEDRRDAARGDGAANPPPVQPNYSFRGDGGCKCDLAAPRDERDQRGLGLGLLFLCVLIARRAFSRSADD